MKIIHPYLNLNDASTIKSIFEHSLRRRIHDTKSGICMIDQLHETTKQWQEKGSVVLFTAGVFDLLHATHLLALTHYRLLGAYEYLLRKGITKPTVRQLHSVAASDAVRLIISVDTDKRVARDKSFLTSKGNSPKPIVSWENRVLLLATQQISGRHDTARPLIDFITKHGDDADICNSKDCPHTDNAYIARALEPDLVIVNKDSSKTLALLQQCSDASPTKIVVIDESRLAYSDNLLGGPLKSSSMIKRAKLAITPAII